MNSPSFCYCLYHYHTICVDPWHLPLSRGAPPLPLHATILFLCAVRIAPARTTSPALRFCASYFHSCPQLRHHVCCKTHPCTCSFMYICASCSLRLSDPHAQILNLKRVAHPARCTSSNLSPSALL